MTAGASTAKPSPQRTPSTPPKPPGEGSYTWLDIGDRRRFARSPASPRATAGDAASPQRRERRARKKGREGSREGRNREAASAGRARFPRAAAVVVSAEPQPSHARRSEPSFLRPLAKATFGRNKAIASRDSRVEICLLFSSVRAVDRGKFPSPGGPRAIIFSFSSVLLISNQVGDSFEGKEVRTDSHFELGENCFSLTSFFFTFPPLREVFQEAVRLVFLLLPVREARLSCGGRGGRGHFPRKDFPSVPLLIELHLHGGRENFIRK
jgi:hypothetical protein